MRNIGKSNNHFYAHAKDKKSLPSRTQQEDQPKEIILIELYWPFDLIQKFKSFIRA